MGIGREQYSDLGPLCSALWSVNHGRSEPEAGVDTLAITPCQVVPNLDITWSVIR